MFREVSRNKKQILSEERCREILSKSTSGVLSLIGDDDYTYGVPLSYTLKDNTLYFHCAKKGHKIDALSKHNKVSFAVIDADEISQAEYTTYFRSVIVFGKARFIEEPDEQRIILRQLAQKYSPDFMDGADDEIDKGIKAVQIIALDIEHISGKESLRFTQQV
ncbi:MAG: pyridoxamine 5'-phosphate oxidase family protein [Firmicutes bacterium]|nr:pyridoxamine 5'-phosphate oxidase family protein [Bacillota bacterium]